MIAKGEIFATYAEFQSALKQYCRETHQEFVVVKSEMINKQGVLDSLRPFKLKEIKCIHHRKQKCKAFIRLNLIMAGKLKMKYLIPSINLQHSNGCPLKTNEGYRCQSDGSSTCSASSTSQSEIVNIVLVMAVEEEVNDYY